MSGLKSLLAALYIAHAGVHAQSTTSSVSSAGCASTIAPQHGQPSVAPGWNVQVVASGLRNPRGIVFDQEGRLLVLELTHGISTLTLTGDDGPCVRAEGEPQEIIANEDFHHGIALSADGKKLYGSTAVGVYAYDYDPAQGRTTSEARQVIGGMGEPNGHTTRTLLMSRKVDDMLLVSRGSMSNLDPAALNVSTGVSTIKGFNISSVRDSPYNFAEEGLLLGWGLRNSVGVGEDPATGAIYSVENSVDDFERNGQMINENNPGEELNFHGYLNGTKTEEQGGNYGYPTCYAAWNVSEIPDNEGIQVGTQFAIGDQNDTVNDASCRKEKVAPRLTFAAHMAPLDIKFNSKGTAAWISFHGSWNRNEPIGYKLSVVGFKNGEPTEPANSNTAAIDIAWNADTSRCPSECFRPVGLAWDKKGRLFFSSDSTGEIYVVTRADGGSTDDASPSSGPPSSPSGTEPAPVPTESKGAATESYKVGHLAASLAVLMAIPLA